MLLMCRGSQMINVINYNDALIIATGLVQQIYSLLN